MIQSFTEQVEDLQGMISGNVMIAVEERRKYEILDQKFKMYYHKSDKYIKDRENKLVEL